MNHRCEHVLQRQLCPLAPVSQTANKTHENVESELNTNTNGQDEDDRGNCAEFDAEDSQSSEQLTNNAGDDEDDERGSPGRHQQQADHDEDRDQGCGQGEKQVESETYVLLPECEGDAVGKVWKSSLLERVADVSHTRWSPPWPGCLRGC